MNEIPDPLEAELSALRPHEVSPGLRRSIADRLAVGPNGLVSPVRSRRLWKVALIGGLVAACVSAVLFRWGGGEALKPKPFAVGPLSGLPPVVDNSGQRFRSASGRSREELQAETATYTWPLEEKSPMTVSTAIPRDLLD
jgi:hypothetical protein